MSDHTDDTAEPIKRPGLRDDKDAKVLGPGGMTLAEVDRWLSGEGMTITPTEQRAITGHGVWVGGPGEDFADSGARVTPHGTRPRIDQYGVYDELATPEQLAQRQRGRYDPRSASGERVRVLVKLWCGRCGEHLGDVAEFAKRDLFYSVRADSWTREPSDLNLKCQTCSSAGEAFTIDWDAINTGIEKSRHAGRTKHVKIGGAPATLH